MSISLKLENFCFGTIGTGGIASDVGEDATFIVVPDSNSGTLPALGEFIIIIFTSSCITPHQCSAREGIRIKSRSGNTLTIKTRNVVGDGAQQAWLEGDKYILSISSEKVEEIESEITTHEAATGTSVHGLGTMSTATETNYAKLAGRAGGQTLQGDTASGGNLTLQSTVHATKGKILFGTSAYDEVNNRLGIGITSPLTAIHISGTTPYIRSTETTYNNYIQYTATGSNTSYPRGSFIVGSSLGDSIVNIGLWVQPDISTGQKNAFLEVMTSKDTGTTDTKRMMVSATTTLASIVSSSGVGSSAGNDISILTYGNTSQLYLKNDGTVGIGTNSPGAKFQINSPAISTIGQIIKAYAGQTADLLQSQNSSGSAISGIGANNKIGYLTGGGAGGTVTQLTSKSTAVTLSKHSGQITMNNEALAANTTVSFTLTNTLIAATDILVMNHVSAGTAGAYHLNAQCEAGSASINVRNITAGSLSEAIVIGFTIFRGSIT